MKFAGCDSRLLPGGYWSYCPCGDCLLRRSQDAQEGTDAAVLALMDRLDIPAPPAPVEPGPAPIGGRSRLVIPGTIIRGEITS